MPLTIDLPPATIEKLEAQAAATGKDVQTIVREAVEAKLTERTKSFLEILKPLHVEVESSGINSEDLDALIQREIAAAKTERRPLH